MIQIIKQICRVIQRRLQQNHNRYKLSIAQRVYFRFRSNKGINQEKILDGVLRYNCAPYWFKHSYQEIFEQETYRFAESGTKNYTIIDCGSNIGLSILYFKLNYPNARIIGIEPDPVIFGLLESNIHQYNFNNVSIINKAAWINNESIEFESKGGMGGTIVAGGNTLHSVKIPAVRLKDLLNQKVDFLKLDIEGAEIQVLRDCQQVLMNVDNLFVEYHCYKGHPLQLNTLLDILSVAGFRYYIRQAYENMEHPFLEKTGAFMDMQLNIFCFRVDK